MSSTGIILIKHEKCIQSYVSKYSQSWAKVIFQEGILVRINCMPFKIEKKKTDFYKLKYLSKHDVINWQWNYNNMACNKEGL